MRFTVAEVGGPYPLAEMKAFTAGDARLNSAYAFDFLYASDLSAELVRSTLSQWPGEKDDGWPSWAFSNHDAPRAVTRWRGNCDPARYAKLLSLLLASFRGNIFVYQGEELGLPQADIAFEDLQDPEAITNWPETLGRDGARTPIPWNQSNRCAGFSTDKPWLPLDDRHFGLTVNLQNNDATSVLNFYREIIALRQNSQALRHGELNFLETNSELLIMERRAGAERRLCVFNLTDKYLKLPNSARAPAALSIGERVSDNVIQPYSGFISKAL